MPLLRGLLCAVLLSPVLLTQTSTTPSEGSAYLSNPKWQQSMKEGQALLRAHQPQFAKDAFNNREQNRRRKLHRVP